MKNDNVFNKVMESYHAMSLPQRAAVEREIVRRARIERARVTREAFIVLAAWLRQAAAKAWGAVFDHHPVFPTRGAWKR
jgi:hypothetical protein